MGLVVGILSAKVCSILNAVYVKRMRISGFYSGFYSGILVDTSVHVPN